MSKFSKIDDKRFIEIVKSSKTFKEVRLNLGYSPNGGSMDTYIKNRIIKLNIDVSHFSVSGGQRKPFKTKEEFIKFLNNNGKTSKLRKYIIKFNVIPYICEICKNDGTWRNKSLTLQLDHIDGNRMNDKVSNLRFLCPNCHTQTDTFGAKNKKYI